MAISPDMKYIASGARDSSICVLDFETIMEDSEISSPFGGKNSVKMLKTYKNYITGDVVKLLKYHN